MKRIVLALGMVLTAAALSAEAQTADADKWTLPRTTDGRPDLQGVWTTQTFTPLQRPDRYAGKEFLTDAEAAELTTLLTQDGIDPLAGRIFAGASRLTRRLLTNPSTSRPTPTTAGGVARSRPGRAGIMTATTIDDNAMIPINQVSHIVAP